MKNLLRLKLTLSTDFGNSNPQDEALVTPSQQEISETTTRRAAMQGMNG
jgi:hypothetical protein